MTDNEIVKALECCMGCACTECPYYRDTDIDAENCMGRLIIEALKLVNRQKAEIERLIEQNARLNKECDHYIDFASTAKAEAIKEFAERLKEKRGHDFPFTGTVFVEEIDNLVKEMTEETK